MRLGVVTTSYPRFPGDWAGVFVSELNDQLMDFGHEVEVIAAGDASVDDSWQRAKVVRVPSTLFYAGGAPDALGSASGYYKAGRYTLALARALARHHRNWDGMVAHWLIPNAIACVLASSNRPVWAIAHGGDVHVLAKWRATEWAARFLCRPNVRTNFVSTSLQATFAKGGAKAKEVAVRGTVSPMGIHLRAFEGALATGRSTGKGRAPTILFIGRLVPIKGVDVLLRAVAGLAVPHRLVIAGTGPDERSLKAEAKRLGVRALWLGQVDTVRRNEVLRQADVVVVPSRPFGGRTEGLPLVAMEALASGARLVVSETGGLGSIPDDLCVKVPAGDVRALRECLTHVLAVPMDPVDASHWLKERSWPLTMPRLFPEITKYP